MENKRIEALRAAHECLMYLPPRKAMQVQKFALWLNWRDGQARMLDRKTLAFYEKPDLGGE